MLKSDAFFYHFTDDTSFCIWWWHLQCSCPCGKELVGVDNRLKANRLSLNISKTSNMIIPNQKNEINIKIQDSSLLKVSTVKFLCITLDKNITFNDHVHKVTTKISKSVCVMRRLHCQLPADVEGKLFYSLVYSHLTYALLAWGRSGCTNAAEIECAHRSAWKLLTYTIGSSLFTQFIITLLY